jgi:hypothetical protein
MLGIYRRLISLYPADHRSQFGEEMIAVFHDLQAEMGGKKWTARSLFYVREVTGLLVGAVQEHIRALGAHHWLLFPTRRFTMRKGFRFPKTTAILMTIILAGVVLAIDQGEAISIAHAMPGSIPLPHFKFAPTVALLLAFFYAAGLLGWAILFALHRSGVHRLDDVSAQTK